MNHLRPLTRLPFFMMITCILTAAAFLTGCGIKNDYTKKQMFRLYADGNAPSGQSNRSAGAPLVIKRLDISPEFSGAGFVYRVGQNRFTQDYYNNYITSPARMISDVMLEALVDTPQFAPAPQNRIPDDIFQLWGKITALYSDQRNTSAVSAVVTMALNLDRLNKDGFTPILSKTYSRQIPLGKNTSPQAYIQALNSGLSEIVKDIVSDYQNLPTRQAVTE
ncbi:ABC transporter [Desulfobacter hydrogenophilus]|uniref:ABC transporter n=1 Tax=Desulfobacter hydrogenophilus TaxID=2291 RepID=A0A328F7F3_9BACT|nr:ABC-type transport auxiliary lipoprotein family protein [Desulfobacter hydrogenophilus]NDY73699.1 ABC transporter [Desulfobacter hydrogenophilus]QBH11787.1 ABC transporter [Desulfobacter hydrogenophilus]RAM00564.1 ABC transporter [Desulfobacter hydrogenophilus]